MTDFTNIFKDGLLVDVDVSFWSGAKVLKAEDLGLKDNEVAGAYKLGRKLLIPQEVIRQFRTIEGRARRVVDENSFPFPIGGARFIPKRKFKLVEETLKGYKEQYFALVESLIENYDEYRVQMLPVYQQAAETAYLTQTPSGVTEFSMEDRETEKAQFIEAFMNRIASYYPPAQSLRAKFALNWSVYEIAIPRMNKQGEGNEYLEPIHNKIDGFIDDVVKVLRHETVAICSRITNNMKEGKIIRTRTIQSLSNFIERFEDLNFVGDKEVEDRLSSLRKDILKAYPQDGMPDNMDLQTEIQHKLEGLIEVASVSDVNSVKSITGEYRRKISWKEEEDVSHAIPPIPLVLDETGLRFKCSNRQY
jgi:hypothetical protein